MSIINKKKFKILRKLLFKAIEICLKSDGHCKHYEGSFEIGIRLPNYFEAQDKQSTVYFCNYACYLICGEGRSKTWEAKSYSELYNKIEKDLLSWLFYHADSWEQNYKEYKDKDDFKQLFEEFEQIKQEFFNI